MKKFILIVLCLIGLSAFNEVSAQHDLDIVNGSSCDVVVTGGEMNPLTCTPGIAITTNVPAGAILPVTYTGAPNIVNKFWIGDCSGNGVPLWDYTMCGFGNNLVGTIPGSACCPSGVTVTLTPATPTTNALINIF